MNSEQFSNSPEEPKDMKKKTYRGFDAEVAQAGADRVRALQKRQPKIPRGVHIAQAENEIARERGISSQTSAEYLRSAIGSASAERGVLAKRRKKENELQAKLREMHRLAAERGDEGIPDEEIASARKRI